MVKERAPEREQSLVGEESETTPLGDGTNERLANPEGHARPAGSRRRVRTVGHISCP